MYVVQIPISEAPKSVPAASRTEVVGDGVIIQVPREQTVSNLLHIVILLDIIEIKMKNNLRFILWRPFTRALDKREYLMIIFLISH